MNHSRTVLLLLLAVVVVFCAALSNVVVLASKSSLRREQANVEHNLRQRFAQCTQSCMRHKLNNKKKHSRQSLLSAQDELKQKCFVSCSKHSFSKKATEKEEAATGVAQQTNSLMSDSLLTAEEAQQQATNHLWELFHNSLRNMLTNGAYTPGFQLVEPTIDLTDIRTQITGWEQMPVSILSKQPAQDYDNAQVFSTEMVQSSKPGFFRETSGISFVQEYKNFLSGVLGVSTVPTPDLADSQSAQKAQLFEYAMNNCTYKYSTASAMITARFDMEQFRIAMCPEVARAEMEMYAQLGREQAAAGNNPTYAAAVALGMAQGMSNALNGFKKLHSLREMEYECLKSQMENRPLVGQSKSMSFKYDYHNWKNTMETVRWQTTKGKWIFKKKINHEQTTVTTMDITNFGGVEIAFADYKYIPLFPGEWYSSSAIRDFRYNQRESYSPIAQFFGDSSSTLTLMPRGIYVAVNPTISFWVESSKKETFKQNTRTAVSSGFRVFGFGFGSGYNKQSSVDEGTTVDGKTKITLSSQSCAPQLFAVDNVYNY